MWSKDIKKYIILSKECEDFLKNAVRSLFLSPRVIHRTIKLARTIADIEWLENIEVNHIAEAIQYRSKSMFIE